MGVSAHRDPSSHQPLTEEKVDTWEKSGGLRFPLLRKWRKVFSELTDAGPWFCCDP